MKVNLASTMLSSLCHFEWTSRVHVCHPACAMENRCSRQTSDLKNLTKGMIWPIYSKSKFHSVETIYHNAKPTIFIISHAFHMNQNNCEPLNDDIIEDVYMAFPHDRRPCPLLISGHDDVIQWNGFRVTGHLCGEFTGHRWIPRTKASDVELWYFLWSAPE